jgi:hypothetical protein
MQNSFNKAPFSFSSPSNQDGPRFNNKDMLFNKKKISSEVMSMSSASSSCSSSKSNTTSSSISEQDYVNKHEENSEIDEDDVHSESEMGDDDNIYRTVRKEKQHSMVNEFNEKRELLYQMDRLESKGFRLPFKFNMESDLSEMRSEYNKIVREKEIDASVRFQRKMMMAFVTGTEYMNTRYDPVSARLEGWSEQVHENINDYDDIFEELHNKYKSSGKKMSPELRLFISLSGSAFMFHLTNRMFKESPMPNVENVLKSNPDLMKQFQAAAAKQYISGNTEPTPSQGGFGGNSGLFGMVNNLFNNISGGPQRNQNYDDDEVSVVSNKRNSSRPRQDVDNIINNMHNKISFEQDQNNIETLSVSDEEITSIIEDTADIKILQGGKKNKNTRTLNL